MKTKPEATQTTLQRIPLSTLRRNPQQQRQDFNREELLGLGNSIKTTRQFHPINVDDLGDGTYLVRDGERRWLASEMVGLTHIDAIVSPLPVGNTSKARLIEVIVTATQRKDLNAVEFARACGELRDMGLNNTEIADHISTYPAKVATALELLNLDEEILPHIASGSLPRDTRVVKALLSVQDKEARVKLATRMASVKMGIRAIESACARFNEILAQKPKAPSTSAPAITLARRRAASQTGSNNDAAKWTVVRAASKGTCDRCDANPHLPNAPEPAWWLITQAATDTCDACALRKQAIERGLSVCKNCPAVDLLQRLASAT